MSLCAIAKASSGVLALKLQDIAQRYCDQRKLIFLEQIVGLVLMDIETTFILMDKAFEIEATSQVSHRYLKQILLLNSQNQQMKKEKQEKIQSSRKQNSIKESLVYNSDPNERMNTEEVFHSYRQSYHIYELVQEISQLKGVIEMKNKEIFYLSTQTVSVKDEYTQKIIHLEGVIAENKREITELRYSGLKTKRQDHEQTAKSIDQIKRLCDIQLIQQKQNYEKIFDKITEQNKKQIQALQQKMAAMITLERKERKNVEQLAAEKCEGSFAIQKQLKQYINKLEREKQNLEEEVQNYGKSLDAIKEEFKVYEKKTDDKKKELFLENQKIKSVLATRERQVNTARKQFEQLRESTDKEVRECQQQCEMLQNQNKKLKELLKKKDKDIEKMSQNLNSVYEERYAEKRKPLDPVRACQHEGLISQMQRNIDLKNKENEELRKQLIEWGAYIGFERNVEDRNGDLLNASSQALNVQASFTSTLRKKFNKLK